MEMLHSTVFWIAVALVIFLALIWFKGRKSIANGIDQKIDLIRSELAQAEQLKIETKQKLSEARTHKADADTRIKEIQAQAKQEVKLLKQKTEARYDEFVKRKQQQSQDRIDQMQRAAIAQIRAEIADQSIEISTKALKAQYQQQDKDNLADAVLGDIAKLGEAA
ncbi:MAG: hypothetical protein AB8B77_01660 [Alphaproteobacteria bacterium]